MTDMSYSPNIVRLTDAFDIGDFPERFGNQIYYSTIRNFEPFSYRSNFSIKLTLQGSETYFVNGQRRTLRKGQSLLVNDGSHVDGFKELPGTLTCGLSIFIEPDLLAALYADACSLTRQELPEQSCPAYAALEFPEYVIQEDPLTSFLARYSQPQFLSGQLEAGDYVEIGQALVDFKLGFERSLQRTQRLKRSTQLEIVARVERAKRYLHDTPSTNFDLNAVARAACLSKFLLIRSFKGVVGITPQQYHQQLRMVKAKELIRRGYSVTEVSACMGYSNIFYFSRQFKQVVGTSPVHWKANQRTEEAECIR